jgi:tRNA-Thr(GGU) m(6)t(6)A37 methyltransferase TsaA
MKNFSFKPIGFIRSELKRRDEAPRQGFEGAPNALIEVLPPYRKGLHRMQVGDEIIVITWLHRASRDVIEVHPRDDRSRPLTGVFSTRSQDRPNPLGLHRVKVLEIHHRRLCVSPIEAIDGTPVIDIKPVLGSTDLESVCPAGL